ncbi:MAG: cell division protein SepF [Bacillota bacterium]|jgi:cell division inhibitor SepF
MGFFEKISSIFYKDEDFIDDEIMEEEYEKEETRLASKNRRPLSSPSERTGYKEPSRNYDFGKRSSKNNMINIPTRANQDRHAGYMEMILIRAKSYDDMQEIANNIKEEKVVVVNFEDMDKGLAQRMVDFLSGAVFALDGMPKKVSGGTFIFSSSKVDLSGQIMEDGVSFSHFTEKRRYQASAPEEEHEEETKTRFPRFFSKG